MKARHFSAVELLLSHPDTTVAEMLGIRLSTLRVWMQMECFADALRAREIEQDSAAKRIARQAVLNAATALCQFTSSPNSADAKALVDILKASGAFETQPNDPGVALAEVLNRARKNSEDRRAECE